MKTLAYSRKKPAKKVRKTPENDETCLHKHCVQWVRKAYPHLLIFHVANERQGSMGAAMHFQRMGVLSGVADFLAFPRGRAVAIELKDDKGTTNAAQDKFRERWEVAGNTYFIARTLEEFQGTVSALMLFS